MPELLLPGTGCFDFPALRVVDDKVGLNYEQSRSALYTIVILYSHLHLLRAANAEGTCPTCPTAEAWGSEELAEIRRAIEEEADVLHG